MVALGVEEEVITAEGETVVEDVGIEACAVLEGEEVSSADALGVDVSFGVEDATEEVKLEVEDGVAADVALLGFDDEEGWFGVLLAFKLAFGVREYDDDGDFTEDAEIVADGD